jgi:hypothetical protein
VTSFRSILIISSHLCLGVPGGTFIRILLAKIICINSHLFPCVLHVLTLIHHDLTALIIIILGDKHKILTRRITGLCPSSGF